MISRFLVLAFFMIKRCNFFCNFAEIFEKQINFMRKIYCILVILCLFACSTRVLDSAKMENLLYDIHIAEATMNIKKMSSAKEIRRSYYDYIFEKHHTTREQFEKSMKWYAANPKKLEIIYQNVKERIDKLQVDIDNYVYHPEEKVLQENKMLDTVQIFKFEKRYNFSHFPPKDSLAFEINDRSFFALSDKFILRFLMQVENFDNKQDFLSNSKNFLTITYSNGTQKTMSGKIHSDSKWYRYTFQMPVNDSIVPVKINGNLFDGNDMIRSLKIDSVALIRIYNAEKYPLSDSIKTVLSISIEPKDTLKTEERKDFLLEKPVELQNIRHSFMQRKVENIQQQPKKRQ